MKSYRFAFNGMEKDDEVKGNGNSLDFGARIYDTRIGRWMSVDPLQAKYPSYTPYSFVNNMPIWAIDPDGRDIIILSAPDEVFGFGHAAILIGNDDDGWYYYSDNGTNGSSGASGPSHKPENGRYVGSLEDFAANDNYNSKGDVEYKSAFRIETDEETDNKMKEAASASVGRNYNVFEDSCIDICSDALEAGGLDGGNETTSIYVNGTAVTKTKQSPVPNKRYDAIVENNEGTDVTDLVLPSIEQVNAMKIEYYQNEISLLEEERSTASKQTHASIQYKIQVIKETITNLQNETNEIEPE